MDEQIKISELKYIAHKKFNISKNNQATINMFCPNCGREEKEKVQYCHQCGTQLKQPIPPQNKPEPQKSILTQLVFAIILIIVVVGVVLSNWVIISPIVIGEPSVHIGEMSVTSDIWTGTRTFNIQVYNSGNAPAKNVYIDLTIYNSDKSKTLASKNLFVGNIESGQTRTVTSTIAISESIVYTASGYIDNPANRFGK